MAVKNIKAVLFDLDDTLFDRNPAQKMVIEIIIEQLPHIFSRFEFEHVMKAFLESDRIISEAYEAGAPSEGIRLWRSRLFLELLDIQEDITAAITEMYVEYFPKVNAQIPGAFELVKGLSGRYQMGVISNGLPDVQYTKLKSIGLHDFMSCVVLSEELGIRKPDPRIFHYAVELLGLKPPDCLHVGNSYRDDITGAKSAGMLSCWLNSGSSESTDSKCQPDFVIGKLEELTGILL
jgi:putative hydrolase of the HAD superfamily